MKQQDERLRALREEALKKASIYQRLFNSDEGQKILYDLRAAFEYPALANEHPHYTHVRAGELNVLRYINDVLNIDTTKVDPNG